MENNSLFIEEQPPAHVTLERDMTGAGHGVTIRYQKVPAIAFILIPFTLVWGGFSIGGIYGSQIANHTFNLQLSLGGLPFVIGAVLLLCYCLFLLFGHWSINLNQGKGTVFMGIGKLGRTREFGYNHLSQISLHPANIRYNNRTPNIILIVTPNERRISFGLGMDEDAVGYLAGVIAKEARRI